MQTVYTLDSFFLFYIWYKENSFDRGNSTSTYKDYTKIINVLSKDLIGNLSHVAGVSDIHAYAAVASPGPKKLWNFEARAEKSWFY